MFQFYSSTMSRATKSIASWTLSLGLFLIAIGILVVVLKAVVVLFIAGAFLLAGVVCISTAIRMYVRLFMSNKGLGGNDSPFRENVRPHQDHRDEII